MLKYLFVVFGLAVSALHVCADEVVVDDRFGRGWEVGGYIETLSLEDDVISEGIGEDAFAFGVSGEYFLTDLLSFTVGGSFVSFDDDDEFRQRVEDFYGDDSVETSDVQGLQLFVDFGPTFTFGADKNAFLTLRGGASEFAFTERSISGCSDCRDEDVDVDGGVYGLVGVGANIKRLQLSLQALQYASGDQKNGVRFSVNFRL